MQTGDIKASGLHLYKYTQTYSEAGLAQSRMWPAGTLCITIAANICDTAILGIPACFPDSIVGFTPDLDFSDVVFIKYALDYAKQRFTGISRGATQDNLSLEKLLSQRLAIPSLPTQCRIASILGAYDDLIEVNRRRIAVLEEMARRLFEEWFVQFRFPGHEGIALVETESGRIPAGWSWARLDEMLVLQRGFDLPTSHRQEGPYPVVTGSGIGGFHSEAKVPAPGIVTGRSGTIGNVFLLDTPFWPLNTALYVKEFRRSSPAHALYLLRSLDLKSRAVGAAVPTLNRNHVHGVSVVAPPAALIAQFERFASDCLKATSAIGHVQEKLIASRDLLLPRLVSGELSVTAAERELEAAD